MKNIFGVCCILLLSIGVITASPIKPADGDTLNYLHVLFKWDQVADAKCYNLQIARNDIGDGANPFDSLLVVDVIDSSLLHIVTKGLEWDHNYIWRVNPVLANGTIKKDTPVHFFSITAFPESLPEMKVIFKDSVKYQPGITVFDTFSDGYLLAVDYNGKAIWHLELDRETNKEIKRVHWLPNGNIVFANGAGKNPGGAWETTIDGDIIWQDPGGKQDKLYTLLKLPTGNYMGLSRIDQLGPIPDGPWKADFDSLGMDSVTWRTSKILEYDQSGNLVWNWNVFDHYSFADYDSASFAIAAGRKEYDWTHINSLYYDSVDDNIYISTRNMDRVTKINHKTGEIIWNMGRDMPSGDVSFGHDLKFNRQHAVEQIANRNIIMIDNGPMNDPPVTRALEIAVDESGAVPKADIAWQYKLPDSLFTSSNGDADRLPNGNTLITCRIEDVERIGHILEVDENGNWVWMLRMGLLINYNSERIPGLYPQAFCVVMPDFYHGTREPTLFLPAGEATLQYRLYNEGWLDETYSYRIVDYNQGFKESGKVDVISGEHVTLSFTGTIYDDLYPTQVTMIVTPEHAPERADTSYLSIYSTDNSITDKNDVIPETFKLYQNYPNPFNPETYIEFDLPEESSVELNIYNIQGQLVRRLVNKPYTAGHYRVFWDGNTDKGLSSGTGIYYYKMKTPQYIKVRKMTFIK
ncbi:aryl-sulfate sulfotransferase [candidate division KSB1 bacterium]|nr:aryl-sulfate sulfotransferase [candidate division KSB1 bacterium]